MHEPPDQGAGSESYLVDIAREADALITTVDDPVTAHVLEASAPLRIIAQYGVGVDNIDLAAAQERGVIVTNTPGVLTDATADFAWALLMAVARNINAADAFVREGRFKRWETTLLLGEELRDKTLGIVGMGRIGAAVARRALGFGMRVVYHNRRRANPTIERERSAHYVPLDTLLETSDIVSLHCPLNEESRHLIDAAALRRMKATALLINTARGPVVDEAALVAALRDGEIAGAGLDVFEREPEVHPGLMDRERVVLAPHLGSATTAARTRMGEMVAEAVLSAFADAEEIPYRVA
jgi:lactate dehydrogenase-like 2-hydroxyacid dehydrogenase